MIQTFAAQVMQVWAGCAAGQGILEDARCALTVAREGPHGVRLTVVCGAARGAVADTLLVDERQGAVMPLAVRAFALHFREILPPGAVLHAGVA